VFNIEGGCYAKVIDLSKEAEPDIYNAIRFGAVLENVVFDPDSREVDYTNSSITENTRCSYPVEYIDNAKIPGTGGVPDNVVFLTCDAFSVLPPVSRLDPAQAMYHFISGYTAKVAGTEMGVTEPQATFLAGQHRLDRRPVRRRQAHEHRPHPRDHRRHPRRLAGQGRDRRRPGVRGRRADLVPGRARRGAGAEERLGRQGRVR
jgi:hypothetical protein